MSRTLVSGLSPVLLLLLLLVALFLGALHSGPAMADQALYSPFDTLISGRSLNQGNYSLTMEDDCNLVLYDGGRAVWATNTSRPGYNCRLILGRNGELVVFNVVQGFIWSSGTRGRWNGNNALVLQRDGKLVVYGPSAIWTAGASTGAAVGGL